MPTGYSLVAPASKVLLVLVPSGMLEADSPGTIVRTRGLLSIATDQVAGTEDQVGAFGIGLVNDVAGALGITALPGPATDCQWAGWFVWQAFLQEFRFGDATGFAPGAGIQYEIDSKAMRKFGSDQSLVMMIENTDAAASLRVALAVRILVKAG